MRKRAAAAGKAYAAFSFSSRPGIALLGGAAAGVDLGQRVLRPQG
jgi:hypothetical protein